METSKLNEYISYLHKKIELQNTIIDMQKNENSMYRSALEEIGAQLTEFSGTAIRAGDRNEEISIKTTRIYFDKTIGINSELFINLESINNALKSYE